MESQEQIEKKSLKIRRLIIPTFCVILFYFSFVEEYFNYGMANIPFFWSLVVVCFLCKFIPTLIFIKYLFPLIDQHKFAVFLFNVIVLIAVGLTFQFISENILEMIFNEKHCGLGQTFFDHIIVILEYNVQWFVVLIGALAIKFSHCYYVESETRQEQENHKLKIESDLIKQQISPKILCNTLHNCGELVTKNNQETSSILLKFSHILRYQLYDSKREYSLLDSEIKFLNQFLEILKFNDLCNSFKINVKGKTIGILVPTLIFSSFFQYETKVDEILCDFEINDDTLNFSITDNYTNRNLEPIKTRLSVIYQDNYKLTSNLEKACLSLTI